MIETKIHTPLDIVTIPQEVVELPRELEELESDERTSGERVRDEFAALWGIYKGRRDGITLHIGNQVIVDDVIATRYYDERAIEEVYWRTQLYSPSFKGGVSEVIFVHVTTDVNEHEIYVDESGEVSVLRRSDADSPWNRTSDAEAQNCLYEFFYRTTIAADIHSRRSPSEQEAADNHAKALLHERYPFLAMKDSTIE